MNKHLIISIKLIFIGLGMMLALFFPRQLYGQFYNGSQMEFGRKRVQFKNFIWTYYKYVRFDTYFYRNGEDLAIHASAYANFYLDEIERKLEMRLDDKVQFIVYTSLGDLKQSNLGYMSNQQYNTGGITHILDNKVFLYFNGDISQFEQQIRAGLARVLIDHMTQGGSIGSQIKNSTLVSFPSWYIDGLVSYLSNPWDTEIDNIVKDGFLTGKYKKFNHLQGDDALYAGHSLWYFIASKYGESTIPDIVYMAKSSRNTEAGFLYVIDVSFKSLLKEWNQFFQDKYDVEDKGRVMPESSTIVKRPSKKFVYDRARVSPDGTHLAFSYNEAGRYKVMLYDLLTGKKKKIYMKGNRLNEKVDYTYPLLAWHPSGELLAFITEEKGVIRLNYYNLETKEKDQINLLGFQQILDASYSPDGGKLLLSAIKKGQSDIYVFDISSGSLQQLTNDIYNDFDPRFIRGMKQVIFSSNRPDDTLSLDGKKRKILNIKPENDLFIMNYPVHKGLLRRVTHTPLANETAPREYKPGAYIYLSDEAGITNRSMAVVDSTLAYVDTIAHYKYYTSTYPITNYSRSIIDHDLDAGSGYFTEILFHDQRYYVHYDLLPEYAVANKSSFVVPQATAFMSERLRNSNAEASEEDMVKKKQTHRRFVNVYEPDLSPGLPLFDRNRGAIEGDSLAFRPGIFSGYDTTQLRDIDAPVDYFTPPKKRNYKVEFTINELVTQVDFASLSYSYQQFTGGGAPVYLNAGFNVFTQVGITDLLEDYRLIGGVKLGSDLTNNEYIINFSDLSGRVDKEIILHRNADEVFQSSFYAKTRNHEFLYKLSYPLNRVLYVSGTGIIRSDKTVYLATDPYNLDRPNLNKNWVGVKGELVFDNSYELSANIPVGSRYKLFGEYYQLVDRDAHNLIVLGMDYRRYDRIHRTLIWANRFAASTSFGSDRLIYYMGGVDNWIGATFDENTPIDYSMDYAYQTLATNMHGFEQNIRNGNSFVILNSELRWPVFQYLFNRPLTSEFLNNFQIVGFGDLGTAWTGWNPYSPENALYREIHEEGSIRVVVDVQKEPLVAGYGFGVRSRLLGYFVRLDCSWGVHDWAVQPVKWYFGLGLDF